MKTSDISPRDWSAGDGAGPARPAAVAELEHVCFDYGHERVLDQVVLTVRRGDFLGIIGPNGSGKTTLLRVLLGLLRPSCGHVRLFDQDIRSFDEWHRVGYIAQYLAFESRFPATVLEVAISGRSVRRGVGRRFGPEDRHAALEALETVGMHTFQDRLLGRLSPGQQQRVFIARALTTHPELLVLDEPTVGVDVEAYEQFYSLLRRLNGQGTTVILVSHDIGVVAEEVTQLACLNRRLVFHGSPAEALRSGALAQLYRPESWMVAHRH